MFWVGLGFFCIFLPDTFIPFWGEPSSEQGCSVLTALDGGFSYLPRDSKFSNRHPVTRSSLPIQRVTYPAKAYSTSATSAPAPLLRQPRSAEGNEHTQRFTVVIRQQLDSRYLSYC